MLRLYVYITMLLCASCTFAQKKEFHYEKDMEWAKWEFTSIEFNDDYTTVRGHFIPGKNGCKASTDKTEILQANGKKYRLLETTLPKRILLFDTAFPDGDTVAFESKFEPIMNLQGTISYTSENFKFDIDNISIDIKPNLRRKYDTYAKRILAWKENVIGEQEYLRYLTHCAEDLSLMPKDSAAIARSYLANCYNLYEVFMNTAIGNILANWNILQEIHYDMTGKKLRKSEQRYLDGVAKFANEVFWRDRILAADNLKTMRRRAEKIFRDADKDTKLYKSTMRFLSDSTNTYTQSLDFKGLRNTYQRALDRYNARDYVGAYNICPSIIHFKYKVVPFEDFKKYCDTTFTKDIVTLADRVNTPNAFVHTYGGMYSDLWSFMEIKPLLETIPYFAKETNDPELISLALNGILTAKGFKYYADRYMKERLSGFNEASVLYRKILSESAALTEMYEDGRNDEGVYHKGEEIKRLKKELLDRQKLYHIDVEDFIVEWGDVRDCLKPKELAVEFQEFPVWNTDSVCYVAITYKHDSSAPRLYTVLKDKKDIINKGFNDSPEFSAKIWDVMKDEIADAENVFFSPSGILHSLPLENSDTTRLYYRLTSTKELLRRNQDFGKLQNCVLYGGLQYGSKALPMLSQRQMRDFTARGPLNDISEQSEAEVITIDSLLREKGVEPRVFKRQYGTEETFKALEYTNVDVIHISTHGFYWEPGKVATDENATDYSFLKLEGSTLSKKEKAMVRSALLFAGAQDAMEGAAKKLGKENGVLTAKEISTMTFPNLKLVVMSACQSGLGDVDVSEGILGLQSAFKMAGAKTILMTLRNVDNHATRLLMEEFYRQYLSGKSMVHALRNAQSFLRNYEEDGIKPYNAPEYWAYFTLLDALD